MRKVVAAVNVLCGLYEAQSKNTTNVAIIIILNVILLQSNGFKQYKIKKNYIFLYF